MATGRRTLPDRYLEVTLRDLEVGTTVYVVPWMMTIDADGRMFINELAHFTKDEAGTSHLKVTKQHGFYSVDEKSIKRYRYRRGAQPRTHDMPVELW